MRRSGGATDNVGAERRWAVTLPDEDDAITALRADLAASNELHRELAKDPYREA